MTVDASDRVRGKIIAPSPLSSEDWESVALGLRERAFFSARVEEARFLSMSQEFVAELAEGEGSVADKRLQLKEFLRAEGYDPGDKRGTLQDLSSSRRLNLILKTNLEQARGYTAWREGQDPAVLDLWPCWELVRITAARAPRDWEARWDFAGGRLYGGRMIARKDDTIWSAISRFETPYPPFDFNSGMGVADIERDEAVELGVIKESDEVRPVVEDFNARLEASTEGMSEASLGFLSSAFGDQISMGESKARWVPDLTEKFFDRARKIPKWNPTTPRASIDIGTTSPQFVAVLQRDIGVDLTGWSARMDLAHVWHAITPHGKGGQAVTRQDLRAWPLVFRYPDRAASAHAGGTQSVRLSASFAGRTWHGHYWLDARAKTITYGEPKSPRKKS
jgi:hypothetical protein